MLCDTHLYLSEAVVAEFVHEAVEEGVGTSRVHPELSLGGEVVRLLQGANDSSYTSQYLSSQTAQSRLLDTPW